MRSFRLYELFDTRVEKKTIHFTMSDDEEVEGYIDVSGIYQMTQHYLSEIQALEIELKGLKHMRAEEQKNGNDPTRCAQVFHQIERTFEQILQGQEMLRELLVKQRRIEQHNEAVQKRKREKEEAVQKRKREKEEQRKQEEQEQTQQRLQLQAIQWEEQAHRYQLQAKREARRHNLEMKRQHMLLRSAQSSQHASEKPSVELSPVLNENMKWTQVYSQLFQIMQQHDSRYLPSNCGSQIQIQSDPHMQQQLLRDFHQPHVQLPIVRNEMDLRFLETSRLAASQIRSVLESGAAPGHAPVFLLLGVSGTGKTSSMFELACEHYVMWIQCCSFPHPSFHLSTDDVDNSFFSMSIDISQAISRTSRGAAHFASNVVAYPFLLSELILRWTYLLYMIDSDPTKVTPLSFLLYQLYCNQSEIYPSLARYQLSRYPLAILWKWFGEMWQSVQQKLAFIHAKNGKTSPSFMIAIDEAQTASRFNMYGSFESVHESHLNPFTETSETSETEASHHQHHGHACAYVPTKRGMLGPLLHICVKMNVPIMVGGTTMGLGSISEIRSDIGKRRRHLHMILVAEYIHNPISLLSNWLNIQDCLSQAACQPYVKELMGRPRLVARVVDILVDILRSASASNERYDRCQVLQTAFQESLKAHKTRLIQRLQQSRHISHLAPVLFKMYLAARLRGGKAKFIPDARSMEDTEWDLMQLGLMGIQRRWKCKDEPRRKHQTAIHSDSQFIVWTLTEPFALDVLRTVIQSQQQHLTLQVGLAKQMLEMMDEYGRKCSGKGFIFEKMIANEWCNAEYQNQTLDQLPFVRYAFAQTPVESMPDWFREFRWDCRQFTSSDSSDAQWIQHFQHGGHCLLPSKSMGPDLYLVLAPNARGEYVSVQSGQKLYTHYLDKKKCVDQEGKLHPTAFFRHVSQFMHDEFSQAWQSRFHVPSPTYGLSLSITLPFASSDDTLPRAQFYTSTSKTHVLLRFNINDLAKMMNPESVGYRILQYASALHQQDILDDEDDEQVA